MSDDLKIPDGVVVDFKIDRTSKEFSWVKQYWSDTIYEASIENIHKVVMTSMVEMYANAAGSCKVVKVEGVMRHWEEDINFKLDTEAQVKKFLGYYVGGHVRPTIYLWFEEDEGQKCKWEVGKCAAPKTEY